MYLSDYSKLIKKEEIDITKLEYSFRYWREMLFEKCVRMFEWKGLPFPQKEIEIRLILQGFCGVVKDTRKGIMCATGSMSGVTQYWDEFLNFTYAAPTAEGGTLPINKTAVIVDNTTLRNPMTPLIDRYASLIAHSEVSLKVALVNLRETNAFSASDQSVAASIKTYHKKMYEGDLDVIVDTSLIDGIKNVNDTSRSSFGVMDCIDARNELLRAFYNEIGVRYTRDKKERMIESEVSNDTQMLLLNINDMLARRKESAEKMNSVLGLNVSVDLSPEFKMITQDSVPTSERERGAVDESTGI